MKTFKTSKAELLFVNLPKDAYDADWDGIVDFGSKFMLYKRPNRPLENIKLPHGDWQLVGRFSETTEDVARELVDGQEYGFINDSMPTTRWSYKVALNNIATHLGLNLEDNIYLLKKL